MIRYNEKLRAKLLECHADVLTFFRCAHVWCFGTDPDLTKDVERYETSAIVPPYVERYLDSF